MLELTDGEHGQQARRLRFHGFGLDDPQREFCRNARNIYRTATEAIREVEDFRKSATDDAAIMKAGAFIAVYFAQFEYAGTLLANKTRHSVRTSEVVTALDKAVAWMIHNGLVVIPMKSTLRAFSEDCPLLPDSFAAIHSKVTWYWKKCRDAYAKTKAGDRQFPEA